MQTLSNTLPKMSWAQVVPGSAPLFGEEDFNGTPEQAASELQSRAVRGELTFGQVLRQDGLVLYNVASGGFRKAPAFGG